VRSESPLEVSSSVRKSFLWLCCWENGVNCHRTFRFVRNWRTETSRRTHRARVRQWLRVVALSGIVAAEARWNDKPGRRIWR